MSTPIGPLPPLIAGDVEVADIKIVNGFNSANIVPATCVPGTVSTTTTFNGYTIPQLVGALCSAGFLQE
jgi:hypothetical protein